MSPAVSIVISGVSLLGTCALVAVFVVERRRAARQLAETRSALEALRRRVDELVADSVAPRPAGATVVPDREYVITGIGLATGPTSEEVPSGEGERALEPTSPRPPVAGSRLGESLVKAAAFGYAVRQALSPEVRNRIAFEMRREVRRSRKQRKRDLRARRREERRDERLRGADERPAA
jgi:hypothetical protein